MPGTRIFGDVVHKKAYGRGTQVPNLTHLDGQLFRRPHTNNLGRTIPFDVAIYYALCIATPNIQEQHSGRVDHRFTRTSHQNVLRTDAFIVPPEISLGGLNIIHTLSIMSQIDEMKKGIADAADAERPPGGFSRDTVRRFETLKGMFESVETHEGGDFYFSFAMMDGRVYVQHIKGHYDVRWVGGRGVESFGLRMDPGEEVWGPYHVH
jgi:hypothetical protein